MANTLLKPGVTYCSGVAVGVGATVESCLNNSLTLLITFCVNEGVSCGAGVVWAGVAVMVGVGVGVGVSVWFGVSVGVGMILLGSITVITGFSELKTARVVPLYSTPV